MALYVVAIHRGSGNTSSLQWLSFSDSWGKAVLGPPEPQPCYSRPAKLCKHYKNEELQDAHLELISCTP